MTEPRPLDGIRVLDLSRLLPGPYATVVLADLGATVDKVEDPGGGDYLRMMPPQVEGMNAAFYGLNRSKRSLILDLKKPEGRDAFLRLLPRYDVVVESFRPGVLERLGLGHATMREVNPRLVICAITGYGQDGPLASRAGHDLNYLARAGVLGVTGPPEGPPQPPGVQMADIGGGALFGVIGILAALESRHRTGEGGVVDVSMCEGSLAFNVFALAEHLGGMGAPPGAGMLNGGIAPYGTYLTKDEGAVSLGALEPKFWVAFCEEVGLEPDMSALAPGPHQAEWKAKVAEAFAQRTRDEWAEVGARVDCCLEPVLTPEELQRDPQHAARQVFLDGPTAHGGTIPQVRTPGTHPSPAPAPGHGEHSEDILREAGFDPSEIEALRGIGATR